MLGLSGTSSYAVFVYLCMCICVCVFVYEILGNISFTILESGTFRKLWFLWLIIKWYFRYGDNQPTNQPGEPRASLFVEQ